LLPGETTFQRQEGNLVLSLSTRISEATGSTGQPSAAAQALRCALVVCSTKHTFREAMQGWLLPSSPQRVRGEMPPAATSSLLTTGTDKSEERTDTIHGMPGMLSRHTTSHRRSHECSAAPADIKDCGVPPPPVLAEKSPLLSAGMEPRAFGWPSMRQSVA
jgi:hypothetical protein